LAATDLGNTNWQRDLAVSHRKLWLAAKLDQIADPTRMRSIQRFATWHHPRRLRDLTREGNRFTDRRSPTDTFTTSSRTSHRCGRVRVVAR